MGQVTKIGRVIQTSNTLIARVKKAGQDTFEQPISLKGGDKGGQKVNENDNTKETNPGV